MIESLPLHLMRDDDRVLFGSGVITKDPCGCDVPGCVVTTNVRGAVGYTWFLEMSKMELEVGEKRIIKLVEDPDGPVHLINGSPSKIAYAIGGRNLDRSEDCNCCWINAENVFCVDDFESTTGIQLEPGQRVALRAEMVPA